MITPIIPLLLVLVPAVYLASNSTENILETNSLRFIMTFGLIGSKITNKLIVSEDKRLITTIDGYRWTETTCHAFIITKLITFRSLK